MAWTLTSWQTSWCAPTSPAPSDHDLEATLGSLAELRARLPEIDGVVLARDARAQLERRGDA